MAKKNDKTIKAYRFFIEAEQDQQTFTLEEVAQASGWSIGTTKTYRTKNGTFSL